MQIFEQRLKLRRKFDFILKLAKIFACKFAASFADIRTDFALSANIASVCV